MNCFVTKVVNIRARVCSHPVLLHKRIKRSEMYLPSPLAQSSCRRMLGEGERFSMSEKGVVSEGDDW